MIHKKIAGLLLFMLLCICCMEVQFAGADEITNRELARTYANFYLRQRDYKQAQQILASHLEQDPSDTEAWNLMGLAAMEAGDLTAAKQAFYQASRDEKSDARGVYLYHYADALNRSGESDKAKDALKLSAQYFSISASAKKAQEKIEAGKKLPDLFLEEKALWGKQVALAAGYDTNVLMAPNTTLANLTASDIASPNALVIGKVSYLKPKFTQDIEANLVAAYQYQTNPTASIYNSLYAGLGGEYRENGDEFTNRYWSIPVKADAAMLNTAGMQLFNWNGGLSPKMGFRLSSTQAFELELSSYYRWFLLASGSDAVNDRSGLSMGALATYKSFWGAWEWSAGLKFDRHLSRGNNFSSFSYLIPIQLTSPVLFWSSKMAIKSEQGIIDYPFSSYLRKDTVISPMVMLFRKFGAQWTGTFTAGAIINSSTTSFADYRKYYTSVMAAYDF